MTSTAAAASAHGAKGPLVWRDLDQAALDDAYDQAVWAANMEQLAARRTALSQAARKRGFVPRRFAYGASEVETLDVYAAADPDAPTLIFIHGGAWRRGAAADFAYAAEMVVKAGANFIALDFVNVDAAQGDLTPMAQQVRAAVAWVYENARTRFGGDPERLYVCGHSSGAHLAANVLTTDWSAFGVPADVVKGGVVCSGMYDLAPVRLSKRSLYVNFTDAMEDALSSQRHIDRLHCPVTVLYGTAESPEFQRQAQDFAATLQAAGKPVELVASEHYNHFEMAETLGNPYGPFGRAVLARMGLAPS